MSSLGFKIDTEVSTPVPAQQEEEATVNTLRTELLNLCVQWMRDAPDSLDLGEKVNFTNKRLIEGLTRVRIKHQG